MEMLSPIIAFIKGSSSLVKLACLDFGIQWGLWTVSAALRTEKFYDLAGKRCRGSFMTPAVAPLQL